MTRSERKTVQVIYPLWGPGRAYRAKEEYKCAGYHCTRIIHAGELYTRHRPQVALYRYATHAFCCVCMPFIENAAPRPALRLLMALQDEYQESDFYRQDCEAQAKGERT